MRRFLLAAMMFGAVSGAQAADMPDLPFLRGGFSEGLTSTKVNWQGFYLGGQAGLGTSDMNFTGATQSIAAHLLSGTALESMGGVSSWPLGGKVSTHGNGFGAFAGYNGQWDDVVLGVEFNYMHGKFGGSQTDSMTRFFDAGGGYTDTVTYDATGKMTISDMASARLRAGYAVGSFLPYVFGGKVPTSCRVVTLGVKAEHRNRGVEAVMLAEGLVTSLRLGIKSAEASWILEDNVMMRRLLQPFGGRVYKTYRIYERAV